MRQATPRRRDYPIIRFLIGSFYVLAVVTLVASLGAASYLWVQAEALQSGMLMGGPLSTTLNDYNSTDLRLSSAAVVGIGIVSFLLLGSIGQFLAMQRDRAIDAYLQVHLLEDILELNEEAAANAADTSPSPRVQLCDGCGRLGALHRIESGQWVCRQCRAQLRSA